MRTFPTRLAAFLTLGLLLQNALGQPEPAPKPVSFPELSKAIAVTMRSNIYDPRALDTPAGRELELQVNEMAAMANEREGFIKEFNRLWSAGPFSHVRLEVAQQPVGKLADFLDAMNVGGGGARLDWQGEVAILTVNTMMGTDTIAQITAAYREIADRKATALIIDLRNNEGGTFAVKPLVGHLLVTNLEAGVFLTQSWTRSNERPPSPGQIAQIKPWRGWSLKAFWRDAQAEGVLRVVFEPMAPRFAGRVYVLTSGRTASAAELATDALLASGAATLVGEKTAGKMLSQKPYDLPNGLQLYLPIADYHSARLGRIEGAGIVPTVRVPAGQALARALELARTKP